MFFEAAALPAITAHPTWKIPSATTKGLRPSSMSFEMTPTLDQSPAGFQGQFFYTGAVSVQARPLDEN
jgi:hypothetical protein